MRVHRLELTAFGPFPGSERIDFDDLTDAGLFLFCGPTGAGKTSVLDAICFGLYGEVPGDRNSAKRLRSDHAAPGVPPAVLLEVTINGRRFRLRRSPAWQRPKRRGSGTTVEQAKVNLEEYAAGDWVHLSNRLDETAHLVTDLLGMNVSQFTQVAMLPQGRFQAFLRAKSDDRHKVLQQLFRTSRFEDVERWLVAHRQSLRAENRAHQEAVSAVVSRFSEAAAAELPAGWDLHDLAAPVEAGAVDDWADELVSEMEELRNELAKELCSAGEAAASARAALEAGRTTADLRERHAAAVRDQDSLTAKTAEMAAAAGRLAAGRRASAVAPLLRVARQAEAAAAQATADLGDVLAEAARLLDADPVVLTPGELATAEHDAREAASVARALLPREAELQDARRALEQAEAGLAALGEEAGSVQERCEALPAELAALRTLLAEQASVAAGLQHALDAERELTRRLESARTALEITSELDDARRRLQERVDEAQGLREKMHDVREARINGMAAELAASLVAGGCCPVCGSAEHPSVALAGVGATTKADEDAARVAYEDADFTRQAQAEKVNTLERRLALADQAAGGTDVAELEEQIALAHGRAAACRRAADEADRLEKTVADHETKLERVRRRAQEIGAETAALEQHATTARAAVERISAELAALFTDEIAQDVQSLIDARSAAGAAFAKARDALDKRDNAAVRAREARRQAADCATEHDFDDLDQAAAAILATDEVAALEASLAAHAASRARVQAVLTDPIVTEAAAGDPPMLAELAQQAREAEDVLGDKTAGSRLADSRADRLDRLRTELRAKVEAWAPTRSAYAVAQSMSAFVEGKGGDNVLQMRLSAYVLASRLKQVVEAANVRLRSMSDERYALEHTATRGVGELRGGLSLQVRDEWTGESRDPATLSGGETFVTSLALALGLADVVTQEVGGAGIDTLFIDEGFGSLDPETLDDVMDSLDALRDGGRAVGIVSHVPEMRTRITAQLQIRKDRSGSHVVLAREQV